MKHHCCYGEAVIFLPNLPADSVHLHQYCTAISFYKPSQLGAGATGPGGTDYHLVGVSAACDTETTWECNPRVDKHTEAEGWLLLSAPGDYSRAGEPGNKAELATFIRSTQADDSTRQVANRALPRRSIIHWYCHIGQQESTWRIKPVVSWTSCGRIGP